MTRLSLFILLVLLVLSSCKESPTLYQVQDQTIVVESNSGTHFIEALTDDIIKVSYSDSTSDDIKVYAPIISASIPMDINESGGSIVAMTASTEIRINPDPFQLELVDRSTGITKMISQGFKRMDDSIQLIISLDENEGIYGTGGRALPMNRRGMKFNNFNRPQYGYGWGEATLNYSIPHYLSSNDYMLLIDDPAKSHFDIGSSESDKLLYSTPGGNTAGYFINGNSFDDLIKSYTDLTGRQPMPPMWTFGHLQSRFGYRSRDEAETILNQTIAAGYPVDAIILDIYWFGPELEDGKMGQLDWDIERWPDPKEMIAGFKDKNIKTITVSEPFFTRKSKHYDFLSQEGFLATDLNGKTMDIPDFYFGVGGLLDIFKPEAKDWIWDQYKYMKSYGIDGWWVDLGEPEKHPDSMMHVNGPAYKIHGIYGHEWAKMLYEGFQKDFPEERLFHMGRAGYAGSQRYGLLPWTGDVGRNWSGFKAQTSMMNSMGISGIPYMHSDAGGFSMGEPDEELYIRWMQFATFTPMFRPHADSSIPPEPVLWPDDVQSILKPYVELRYKLLPYHYTMGWNAHAYGTPMAKPLFLEYPEISDTVQQQYLWGPDMIVAPVTSAGIESLNVHLPKGTWYDFHTDEPYQQGNHSIDITLNETPVFIKGGSIIPMIPLIQNTSLFNPEDIELHYYWSEEPSSGQIYLDDGTTPGAYLQGDYYLVDIHSEIDGGEIKWQIDTEGVGYHGLNKNLSWNVIIHGLDAPLQVMVGDTSLPTEWDDKEQEMTFEFQVIDGASLTLRK